MDDRFRREPSHLDFYRRAERSEQISIRRPFYPNKPGGSRQRYLIEGLGVEHINDLRRRCELATLDRRAAGFDLMLTGALASQIQVGFGHLASGKDPFDALIGVCGLVNLYLKDQRPIYEPEELYIRDMEGWILGQASPKPDG